MVISLKDSLKLIGIIIVSFCAVFVCTFFLNFYLDASKLEGAITDSEIIILYDAQMATAKFTCAITGGFLALIAVIMLIFYIKLYIDGHSKQLGILKAMGYSDGKIALRFAVFGISVLLGTALGFGCGFVIMPNVYKSLTIDGLPHIAITFHAELLIALIVAPSVLFSALAVGYAYLALRRPVSEMLRGKTEKKLKNRKIKEDKERAFLVEMLFKTLGGRKSLAFFIAFACFCFSAMIQMSVSMLDLSTVGMGAIILVIGVVLAVTTMLMATESLIRSNIKNISIMKAFGYSLKESSLTVLGGYHIFALIGFAVGTVYQYVLLRVMVDVVYKDVVAVPEYNFNVSVFFITLAVFIVFYEAVMLFYTLKMSKISVKEVMEEN
ncbi:MAG: FtsX-like permease family protein [Clostridia bacterium]|nr:FtsX-like permease family protein [Clostridia bacterium]